LRDGHFTPQDIAVLAAVFEEALEDLRLVDRNDPAVTMVAKRIIALAREGEREYGTLRSALLKSIRNDPDGACGGTGLGPSTPGVQSITQR
jgi:hypothetical protein